MREQVDRSRRALLFGRSFQRRILRPPWAEYEARFLERCTGCGDCVSACETGILVRGDDNYPEVDFSRGECTFCGACVTACGEQALHDPSEGPAWDYIASLTEHACLAEQGVYCRSCGESCEAGAIRFSFNSHRVPEPSIDLEACTGCGACVESCPTQAIKVGPPAADSARKAYV